jgi:hypothetical protein
MTAEETGGEKVADYVKKLARALRSVPESDRADIVDEIRTHLLHRAREGRLEEAIRSLGPPETCARSFLDEMKIQDAFADGGPAKTVGALLALASRRATATAGLFVSLVFFLLAAGFVVTAGVEVVAPDKAGLWVNKEAGVFILGTYEAPPTPPGAPAPPPTRELLGRWLLPVAAGASVLCFVIGQWLARFFVRLMARRKARVVM